MPDTTPLKTIPPDLVQALKKARCITILTGAGISSESGIPTFRDSQTGLWAKYNPHELATPEAFEQDPKLVMDWYRWRRDLVLKARPNPGHYSIVELQRQIPNAILITQNVDGLHQAAGSTQVIELHGNIHRLRCASGADHGKHPWTQDELPRCPICSRLLRPDIVWFGEALPAHALEQAVDATHGCDLFFSIGTSGIVEPAASLPYEALRSGAAVIEINPSPTPLTVYARFYFPYPSGSALPKIVQAAFSSGTTG